MNANPAGRQPIVTYSLIGLCVLCYIPIATGALPAQNSFALYFPENPLYHIWQYITSLFMHGSLMHLLFNMLALWMFGSMLERLWGGSKFLLFYMLCGIGAGLIYTWINQYQFNQFVNEFRGLGLSATDIRSIVEEGIYRTGIPGLTEAKVRDFYLLYHIPVVGASGAIYGILVAFAICFPNHKLIFIFIPYPVAAKYFVPVLLLIDLLSGVTGFSIFGGNVAHFAHVGGGVVGFLLVWLLGRQSQNKKQLE